MKKALSLFSFQFAIWVGLLSQAYQPTEAKQYQSMIGEVHILSLFVDTKDGYWEDNEVDIYYNELERSQS